MTGRIQVLVVDDHPVFRDGLRQLLDSAGEFTVVAEAADGLEALACASRYRVDVVLMDLNLPRMDGVTATARLRAITPEAKVLVLTTYDSDEHVLPAIEAGAVGYLDKTPPPSLTSSASSPTPPADVACTRERGAKPSARM